MSVTTGSHKVQICFDLPMFEPNKFCLSPASAIIQPGGGGGGTVNTIGSTNNGEAQSQFLRVWEEYTQWLDGGRQ